MCTRTKTLRQRYAHEEVWSIYKICYETFYFIIRVLATQESINQIYIGLETLDKRRDKMCLKFAKQCLKLNKMKDLFPKNESDHSMTKRNTDAFKVVRASTERFHKSAIPSMVKLLNEHEAKKQKQFKKLSTIIPVNYVCNSPYHCNNKSIQ